MSNVENKMLALNLEVILNKNIKDITLDDFEKVKCINFTKKDSDGNQIYTIKELLNLKKLEVIIIEESVITQEDFMLLSSLNDLQELQFSNCFFENNVLQELANLSKLKNLSLNSCYIEDYTPISNLVSLEFLEIKYPYNDVNIDINTFNKLTKLQILVLEGCIISNENKLSELNKLELLSLLSTELNDLTFINKCPNLKKLYISNKYKNYIKYNSETLQVFDSYFDLLIDDQNNSKGFV